MATTRPFVLNTGSAISGTTQIGNLAVGNTQYVPAAPPSGELWWMGPDEEIGFVIAHEVDPKTQITPLKMIWDSLKVGTGVILANDDLTADGQAVFASAVANRKIISSERAMFSIRVDDSIITGGYVGLGKSDMDYNSYVGGPDGKSIGFGADGTYLLGGSTQVSGLPTWGSLNDIVDVAVDGNLAWVRVNGGNWNGNPAADPSAGTNGVTVGGLIDLYAAVTPYGGQATILTTSTYTVPGGFIFIGGTLASVGFNRTKNLTDLDFIDLAEYVSTKFATPQTFATAILAKTWLDTNGFWSSYSAPVLALDAATYSGSGSTWTDIVNNKSFTLYNNPVWAPENGGNFTFDPSSGQYARSSTSLSSLGKWTVEVWHYYNGTNTGLSPCIVTEKWPNSGGNINYTLGSVADNNPNLSAAFFNGAWRATPTGYTLTANNWYHIVGTYDGTTIKLYVNNTLVQSTNYIGGVVSGQDGIVLMRRWDDPPGGFWGGRLAIVNIYDKAIDATTISQKWNTTKSRFGL